MTFVSGRQRPEPTQQTVQSVGSGTAKLFILLYSGLTITRKPILTS